MTHTTLFVWWEKYDSNTSKAWAADGTVMCVDPAKTLTQPRTKLALFLPSVLGEDLCFHRLNLKEYPLWKIQEICPLYFI